MIAYYRLFDLLNRKGMKKTDLVPTISAPTLAKMGNNYSVGIEVINRLCEFLNCQPGDIMEFVPGPQPDPKDKATTKETVKPTAKVLESSEDENPIIESRFIPETGETVYLRKLDTESLDDKVERAIRVDAKLRSDMEKAEREAAEAKKALMPDWWEETENPKK